MSFHPLIDQLEKKPDEAAQHGGWTAHAVRGEGGSVGLKADGLRLRRDAPSSENARTLARRLARRATYLLEPLEVVESEEHRALLRSQEPADKGEQRDYYDLWVTPDELSLERYHAGGGERRQSAPLNLTWEQAERLVRDVETIYESETE